MKKSYVLIEFDGNETSFDINVERMEYLITALMGMEAYCMKETGLDLEDLREIVDEARASEAFEVKPKEPFDPKTLTHN